jgi:hypothetical protein
MDLSTLALIATVSAPYGVPVDGYPSYEERVLLLWTNAVRVDPEAFEDEYESGDEPCSFDDFEASEQEAKDPMYIDLDLTEVARVHSTDMAENGCFQHESCDGTDTWTRIAEYYDDTTNLGENIAMGTDDPYYAVTGMWMCSSGHRANIMNGDYNEMGPGIDGIYLTQDFAVGSLEQGDPPVRMAVDDDGLVWADWGDSDGPKVLEVVTGGIPTAMELTYGAEDRGVYSVEPEVGDDPNWYVYWETASGAKGTFPEEGSFSPDGEWVDEQAQRGGLFGDVPEDELDEAMIEDLRIVGCSTSGGSVSAMAVIAGVLAARRR